MRIEPGRLGENSAERKLVSYRVLCVVSKATTHKDFSEPRLNPQIRSSARIEAGVMGKGAPPVRPICNNRLLSPSYQGSYPPGVFRSRLSWRRAAQARHR